MRTRSQNLYRFSYIIFLSAHENVRMIFHPRALTLNIAKKKKKSCVFFKLVDCWEITKVLAFQSETLQRNPSCWRSILNSWKVAPKELFKFSRLFFNLLFWQEISRIKSKKRGFRNASISFFTFAFVIQIFFGIDPIEHFRTSFCAAVCIKRHLFKILVYLIYFNFF